MIFNGFAMSSWQYFGLFDFIGFQRTWKVCKHSALSLRLPTSLFFSVFLVIFNDFAMLSQQHFGFFNFIGLFHWLCTVRSNSTKFRYCVHYWGLCQQAATVQNVMAC